MWQPIFRERDAESHREHRSKHDRHPMSDMPFSARAQSRYREERHSRLLRSFTVVCQINIESGVRKRVRHSHASGRQDIKLIEFRAGVYRKSEGAVMEFSRTERVKFNP